MDKPKTRVSDWNNVDTTSDKGITAFTVEGLDPWEVQEAYEEMIDALIDAYEFIGNLPDEWQSPDIPKGGYDVLESTSKALKKAGVEL